MRLARRIVLVLLVLAFAIGCAGQTPKSRYAASLAAWNDLMDSYRYRYSQESVETQAAWDRDIGPKLGEASRAMDHWGDAQNDYTKEQAFISLERQAIQLLVTYGIAQKKEGVQ